MVAEISKMAGKWKVSVSDIRRFVTRTADLDVVHPLSGVRVSHLSGPGTVMSDFHVELRRLIQSSTDLADFKKQLLGFLNVWGVPASARPTS